jgi:hypothetical protein
MLWRRTSVRPMQSVGGKHQRVRMEMVVKSKQLRPQKPEGMLLSYIYI